MMPAKCETLLQENCGVKALKVDGAQLSYADIEKAQVEWKQIGGRKQGRGLPVRRRYGLAVQVRLG